MQATAIPQFIDSQMDLWEILAEYLDQTRPAGDEPFLVQIHVSAIDAVLTNFVGPQIGPDYFVMELDHSACKALLISLTRALRKHI